MQAKRAVAAVLTAVAVATLVPDAARAAGAGSRPARCSTQSITVGLTAADPRQFTVRGRLCLRDDRARGRRTVLVMVSGLTYDHRYFDSPYRPDRYSWVDAATRHGYSTFVFDRLGVGTSDKPPADALSVAQHAYTVEQIVRRLRTGRLGGRAFGTVVGIGHSLGAGILQYLAGTGGTGPGVPNALVLSGWLHQGNPAAVAALGGALVDAATDPAFASAGLPEGYLTTRPGTRGALFYHTATAEPAVIAQDEAMKQTGTLTERQTLAALRSSEVTLGIRVPVLLSVGRHDTLQCAENIGLSCADAAAVRAREARYYGPAACLAATVVPGAGHSVNFHPSARTAYAEVNRWLDRHVAGRGGRAG